MILNLRPAQMGLLDCVVEELDVRFGEEEQEGLLRVVRGGLGGGEGGVDLDRDGERGLGEEGEGMEWGGIADVIEEVEVEVEGEGGGGEMEVD